MYKRLCALALALCLLLALSPARAGARHVLCLTTQDSPAGEAVRRLALYGNWNCRFQDAAEPIDLTDCERIILCLEDGAALPAVTAQALRRTSLPVFVIGPGGLSQLTQTQQLEGTLVVRTETESRRNNDVLLSQTAITLMQQTGERVGGSLFVGSAEYPLCHTSGHLTHLACFDSSASMFTFLSSCLQQWSWPFENAPRSYGQYLVLDNVYPFDDPARLLQIADMLEAEAIPYSLAVMPLYSNGEFPAMKRFCEFLAYAQSKGAGIILHMPQVTLKATEADDIAEHLQIAFQAYTNYGVYPLAVKAPESWLQSEKGLGLLTGIRTVFLYDSGEPVHGDLQATNLAWKDGHQLVAPSPEDASTFTNAYAQAIYLDINQDVEALRQQVQQLKASRRTLKSLRSMENVIYMGKDYLRHTPNSGTLFNGKAVNTAYQPFTYEENYRFDRGFVQNLTEQIESGNHLIMLFVVLACGFFVLSIILARRNMREELLLGRRDQRSRGKESPP